MYNVRVIHVKMSTLWIEIDVLQNPPPPLKFYAMPPKKLQHEVQINQSCDEHTSYLSRTLRTLSVEQKCGAILLRMEIFDAHVEQNCFTSQVTLPHKAKLFVMWINCSLYQTLLHVANLQCMLFYSDLRCFDAKSILLQFTHFCVEQKSTNTSCLWRQNYKYYVCPYLIIVTGTMGGARVQIFCQV